MSRVFKSSESDMLWSLRHNLVLDAIEIAVRERLGDSVCLVKRDLHHIILQTDQTTVDAGLSLPYLEAMAPSTLNVVFRAGKNCRFSQVPWLHSQLAVGFMPGSAEFQPELGAAQLQVVTDFLASNLEHGPGTEAYEEAALAASYLVSFRRTAPYVRKRSWR